MADREESVYMAKLAEQAVRVLPKQMREIVEAEPGIDSDDLFALCARPSCCQHLRSRTCSC
jgi:hypothetical protein